MNSSIVNIMNLPDEILIIIWNKLSKIDVLYSFLNVNRRFDKLVRDKIYTRSIELIKNNCQTFNFNIITYAYANNQLYENIKCTFLNGKFSQVDFYLDQYPNGEARSHIYSLPYKINVMHDISSNFPIGLFTNVHDIWLADIFCPFEHKFYDRIARSFPFLTELTVINYIPRNYKPLQEANNNNQVSSVIVFPHLTHLHICSANINVAEQFLVDNNTLLPRLIHLSILYRYIEEVTENFTRKATRRNCVNIKRLNFFFSTQFVHCEEFYLYFPCYK
ncbi:unnamed protein product [Rotaria socialis]|uniref:F-box domain-containing protein n=1 Tax=Rotaria socialis TaxID=392032 RepID=A0A818U405_9BILA|nr:unnamed protein product [Rotaria socialis]CAF3693029.1 unnamed protein product [Rotaria socialis]CAF4621470.1 unnamed protein product [Rotaria socialis]